VTSIAPRCPLCASDSDAAFTVGDRNRRVTVSTFHYRRCRTCRTLFLADVPADLGRYYPDEYYALPARAALERAAAGEAPKLALMRPFVSGGMLLEIGAAFGIFALAAARAGFDVTAIEMDARCCTYLEDVVGVSTICTDAPDQAIARLGPAKAVTMWHVLEHLPRPWEVLARAAERLEQGGVLAVATPNPDSLQFRLLGARWAHVDAPRHLFLIPFAALAARMDDLGFDVGRLTTSDPAGRYWNVFGWEYALRRNPSRHQSTRATRACSRLLARAVARLERRGMNGSAYTAVFVKR
jgi:2-polyprenyl-3-methyl-5-hydroxy-6-metoxy-1,4-benzoquinol methylase